MLWWNTNKLSFILDVLSISFSRNVVNATVNRVRLVERGRCYVPSFLFFFSPVVATVSMIGSLPACITRHRIFFRIARRAVLRRPVVPCGRPCAVEPSPYVIFQRAPRWKRHRRRSSKEIRSSRLWAKEPNGNWKTCGRFLQVQSHPGRTALDGGTWREVASSRHFI